MDHDRLFLETLADLQARVENPSSEYEVVMTAPLLRKLLLESPTLTDLVNRERRVKVSYVVNGPVPVWKQLNESPPTAYSTEDGFDPETAAYGTPTAVSRDGLLSQMVMVYRGHEVTAKDLIRYVALTAGGVHFDPPKSDGEKAAQSVAHVMTVTGYPAGSRTLLAIGRVVVRGLEPLRGQVAHDVAHRPQL